MIWLMLATLAIVFVVGFQLLTAGSRHAAQALSKRLQLPPVHVESLLAQMGKEAANEFTDYIRGDNEAHLNNGAAVLLIWQVLIVDGSDENAQRWHHILTKAGFSALISRQQLLLALGFLRQLEPDSQELNALREQYNARFTPQGIELEGESAEVSNLVSLSEWRQRH
ncbi:MULTISPECIES: DUF1198 family protein [Pantoea]|jgi:hypothetical protein|uniref:DUF1198 family protein n=1 Tax=Pantoea TaxID=53335 RepID=UPI00073706FB|nr:MULTISPECIES: DUF1198 family protein [Pantoea]KTS00293.1 hypothetical protein NS375_07000 [Pantoea dispersa]KTS36460.1 hypothetical protein NS389_01855 [Pantoea dispersa]KTS57974.1 hypothetical protein NS380_12730 [Pantoea dispersa]MBS0899718.1 DUF1198 domain-containing protein [Pantoea dispersa]MCI1029302.1 DUF1198 domain-containing protein [Pantoea dispersa]